jgi:hypothetical protein
VADTPTTRRPRVEAFNAGHGRDLRVPYFRSLLAGGDANVDIGDALMLATTPTQFEAVYRRGAYRHVRSDSCATFRNNSNVVAASAGAFFISDND